MYNILDEETYNQFLEVLDAPIINNDALKKVLESKPPWEQQTIG